MYNIKHITKNDIVNNLKNKIINTRFPPEPNGHLHIGHAKSIFLNFHLKNNKNVIKCNIRFDDTNPENEEKIFIETIKNNIKWLGFNCKKNIFYTSDYFNKIYNLSIYLINNRHSYICKLTKKTQQKHRGILTKSGKNSKCRFQKTIKNLIKLRSMKNGLFKEESCTLRAIISMSSNNFNLRDPTLYRIKKIRHINLKKIWFIYPMYDFSHSISDSIEKISYSLCTLEFQNNKIIYNWIIEKCKLIIKPKQIEFSRLNIYFNITSKRKLKYLIRKKIIYGWDDPRILTINGLKRRGYSPSSIKKFCNIIGISKKTSYIENNTLSYIVRKELNEKTERKNVVFYPLLIKLDKTKNYFINIKNSLGSNKLGKVNIKISKNIFLENNDFLEKKKKNYRKISIFKKIRLINYEIIKCYNFKKNNKGKIIKLFCKYILEKDYKNYKYKTTINLNWVDSKNSIDIEIRNYGNLFYYKNPYLFKNIKHGLNKNSLNIIKKAKSEILFKEKNSKKKFQFLRSGYFYLEKLNNKQIIFNKITSLSNNKKKLII